MEIESNEIKKFKWDIIGNSVRGASHIRKNLPNQDAINWESEKKSKNPAYIVVSDGHGDEKHCTSLQL